MEPLAVQYRVLSVMTESLDQKILNRALAFDFPLQTFVVGLTRRIYRLALPLVSPETLFSSSKYFLIMHTLLYFSGLKDGIIMVKHTHR